MAGRPPIDRNLIVRSAVATFLAKGATAEMADIRRAARIGSSTLFRTFSSRAELIEELIALCLRERHDRLHAIFADHTGAPEAVVTAAIDCILRWTAEEPRHGYLLNVLTVASQGERVAQSLLADHRDAEIAMVVSWARPLIDQRVSQQFDGTLLHGLVFGPTQTFLGHAAAMGLPANAVLERLPVLARAAMDAVRFMPSWAARGTQFQLAV